MHNAMRCSFNSIIASLPTMPSEFAVASHVHIADYVSLVVPQNGTRRMKYATKFNFVQRLNGE